MYVWCKFQAKETDSSSDKEEEEEGETPLITGKAPISEQGIFSQSSKSASSHISDNLWYKSLHVYWDIYQ